jgi:hypothetical protein
MSLVRSYIGVVIGLRYTPSKTRQNRKILSGINNKQR